MLLLSPLRWGIIEKCIAYCGFRGLNDKIGESDIFGRELRMTKVIKAVKDLMYTSIPIAVSVPLLHKPLNYI